MRAYFDAGVGAELEGGDDGAGVDLRDLAVDVELGALLDQDAGLFAQRLLADDGLLVAAIEQRRGRQLVAADALGDDGDGLDVGVGAPAEGDAVGCGAVGQVRRLPVLRRRASERGSASVYARAAAPACRRALSGSRRRRAPSKLDSSSMAWIGAAARASASANGAAAAAAVPSGVTGGASTRVRGIACHMETGSAGAASAVVVMRDDRDGLGPLAAAQPAEEDC